MRRNRIDVSEKQILVTLGNNELYNFENVFEVQEVTVHWAISIDLAMIVLKQAAQLGPRIQPICLWPKEAGNSDPNGNELAGHGLQSDGEISKRIKKEPVILRSSLVCLKNNPSFINILEDGVFCADYLSQHGRGICRTDTGGGLFKRSDQSYFLRGVILKNPNQWPKKGCTDATSVVIKDISDNIHWIEREIA